MSFDLVSQLQGKAHFRKAFIITFQLIYTVKSRIKNLEFSGSGCHWFLSRDYDLKYQAVWFLNRFLIYETLDVRDNLHFY